MAWKDGNDYDHHHYYEQRVIFFSFLKDYMIIMWIWYENDDEEDEHEECMKSEHVVLWIKKEAKKAKAWTKPNHPNNFDRDTIDNDVLFIFVPCGWKT